MSAKRVIFGTAPLMKIEVCVVFRAKHSKKGQFTLKRKKSKAEFDFEDMLCPIK